jgi:peptide/nickel transport system permease protein
MTSLADLVNSGGSDPDRLPVELDASRQALVWRRLRRSGQFISGMLMLIALFAFAWIGPRLTDWRYNQPDFKALLKPPSSRHWFGTTQIGNDVFAQTTRGLQKSLIIGLAVALIAALIASVAGIAAGYRGGKIDVGVTWSTDLLLVLPSFLVIAIVAKRAAGSSWLWLIALLALFSWMLTARLLRAMTQSLRNLEYVKAAEFMGVSRWRIGTRHLLPNVASLLIVDTTLSVGAAVLAESSLSFLGFGVQSPDVSLGSLIGTGSTSTLTSPWLFGFSAGILVLLVLAVNLIGDGLRDAIDPTSRQRGRA